MQPDLFTNAPKFDGPDLVQADHVRLTAQQRRIVDAMSDGRFWTLRELSAATGAPEASVSAQLRHLRRPKFGAHAVDRIHAGGGLYRYRLVI